MKLKPIIKNTIRKILIGTVCIGLVLVGKVILTRPGEVIDQNLVSTSHQLQKIIPGQAYQRPSDDLLHQHLTRLQYRVTQQNQTEPAFQNLYWNYHAQGIYVDIVSGEPLFSSADKYVSGTGWPSFTQPIEPENIVTQTDYLLGYPRTEVRSRWADSHLGHVFNDGPEQRGGIRYCINSAALMFIPKDELESQGYGRYISLFSQEGR